MRSALSDKAGGNDLLCFVQHKNRDLKEKPSLPSGPGITSGRASSPFGPLSPGNPGNPSSP